MLAITLSRSLRSLAPIALAPLAACGDCSDGRSAAPAPPPPTAREAGSHRPRSRLLREAGTSDAASTRESPLRGKPKTNAELPTTTASDADLDGGTDDARVALAYADRARAYGDLDDLGRALAAIDRALAADERLAVRHATKARILVDLHRVQSARSSLARARELGAASDAIALAAADLDWMTGAYASADGAIRKTAQEKPSAEALLRLARLEHDTGDDAAAERSFERAEDLYEGTSPFLLAEIDLARGMLRLDAGKPDEAAVFLREALARVPGHTRAATRLAQTLDHDKAIALLAPLAKTTKDPWLLAADDLRARATARIEDLVARHGEDAWLDAGTYFLAIGDAKRALGFLVKEIEPRPTATTFAALARARFVTNDLPGARAAIERALASPVVSARLDWTAARVFSRLGETGKAQELSQRARLRNPKIESEEPSLTP